MYGSEDDESETSATTTNRSAPRQLAPIQRSSDDSKPTLQTPVPQQRTNTRILTVAPRGSTEVQAADPMVVTPIQPLSTTTPEASSAIKSISRVPAPTVGVKEKPAVIKQATSEDPIQQTVVPSNVQKMQIKEVEKVVVEPKPTVEFASETPKPKTPVEKKPKQTTSTRSAPQIVQLRPKEQRRPSRDTNHLSMACHLFPRLSESNLQFHDCYWGREANNQVFLRRRVVTVSVLLNFHSLQFTTARSSPTQSDQLPSGFKLKVFLIDLRPQTGEQVVSNILEVPLEFQQTSRFSGLFCRSGPLKTILVRSNYKQPKVVVRIELLQGLSTLGYSDLRLLNEQGQNLLTNKSQVLNFGENFKINLGIAQPSNKLMLQADMLPDILLCLESWIPMIAAYRQVIAEVLADWDTHVETTWLTDPIVATFPTMCENQRLATMFVQILSKNQKYDSTTFRRLYMNYIFPLVNILQSRNDEQLNDYRSKIEKNSESPLKLLSESKCAPLNVYDYAVHLSGYHALD
ncbi:SH3 domain-containing protein [Aphelenchoides besseyi]|nr:SH3 domain-containing protein [Aphelenchoides besseyi]KAI6211637.1 SH3 domain-containing protein [Aphelenchoides besseyi]